MNHTRWTMALAILSTLTACGGGGSESTSGDPSALPPQTAASSPEGNSRISPQAIADKDRAFIDERLADPDASDAGFLRMVRDLGSFQAYQDALDTWDEAALKALHQKYGLDYVKGMPSDTAAADAAATQGADVTPLNITDCVQFFPASDRNKTFDRFGHQVHIDNSGRPSWSSKTWASGDKAAPAARNVTCQARVGAWGEGPDVGGHMIAASLGGYGGRANLIPQNGKLNGGLWRVIENTAAYCLGKSWRFTYTMYAYYPNRSAIRPNEIKAKMVARHSAWQPWNIDYGEYQIINHVPTDTEYAGGVAFANLLKKNCD